jgi:transposase InsO family protein
MVNVLTTERRKTKSPKGRLAKRYESDMDRWKNVHLAWDINDLQQAVNDDPVLYLLKNWKTKPNWSEIAGKSKEIKFYYHHFGMWQVDTNGLIWYKWVNGDRSYKWKLLIPRSYIPKVLYHLHNSPTSGHFGERRTISALNHAPVFWFRCKSDVRKHCRLCDDCFCAKASPKKNKAKMQSFGAGEPMERVGMDIAGPFRVTERQNQYVYVIQDYFTKYVVMIPVVDHKADTLTRELVTHVFSKIGVPRYIHSDQGAEFCSAVFQETCRIFGIDKTRTTPFRPQSDGMVERMNRVVGAMLRQYVDHMQSDWDLYLPLCAMAYNSTIHSSTGFTPNKLMFGRELYLPLELVLPDPDFPDLMKAESFDSVSFVDKLDDTLTLVYSCARENLNNAMLSQKHYYDDKAKNRSFKVGDSVWLYNPRRAKGRSPKLDKCWEGPYGVVATYSPVLVEIRKGLRAKSKIVHVDKLAHTKNPIDMSWVSDVPHLHENLVEDYRGLDEMYGYKPYSTEPDVELSTTNDDNVVQPGKVEQARKPDIADTMAKTTRSGLVYNVGNTL